MQRYNILWADDEVDLLRPHIIFLEEKGYDITPVKSGSDAIDKCRESHFDLVFLDEHMPGMSGLEALAEIKLDRPGLPVVMITKNEEEHIMEEAIGSKISDYLIKPVNPNQILMSVKKILDNKRLVSEKTNAGYQRDFINISTAYNDRIGFEEWAETYKKLVYWELEFDNAQDKSMLDVFLAQKSEADKNFSQFIAKEYESWLNDPDVERPVMSHRLMEKKVLPLLDNKPVFFILIDNLRFDQWKVLKPVISDMFDVEEESHYYSILPTTTAYARNALFAGMMPADIAKYHSDLWVNEESEEGKNNHEEELLRSFLDKHKPGVSMSYHKVINNTHGKAVVDKMANLMHNDLNVVVYNFVDMLSHARTDTTMVRELAPDESAYRSITKSWFEHSPFFEAIKEIAARDVKLVITTDHGTVRVKRPFKIVGDRNVNSNLRYKQGKSLGFNRKDIFSTPKPERFHLPKMNISSEFVFASADYFFAYPNNFNYYVNYYKDTFQHGGVSMEEMIIPFAVLSPKNA